MSTSQNSFRSPPKRFQPRGLTILHEDNDILVVDKINGLLTVATEAIRERTAYFLLNEYVRKGNPKSKKRVLIVHRLDKDTSGILVFAKNEHAKRYLQDQWQDFKKTYYAVVHGTLSKKEDVITSYLAESSAHKMYSVADPKKGKLARTGYRVLRETKNYSLLEIHLHTGRKNQIRVHFAEKGVPVVGDRKYGIKVRGSKRLALHAASLTIAHPGTKETMTFETKIPADFLSLMKG